jgi:cytochrome c553
VHASEENVKTFACVVLALAPLAAAAQASQASQALYTRALAANCAGCHGTDGHPAPGSSLARLAGMPRESMLQQLRAFRDGSRSATVMQQIAKGYSEAQLAQLADYFAARAK